MSQNVLFILIYVLFWLARLNGCIRRARQPLLRGRDWFFNVRVPPDFYTGRGRRILRRYRARMLIPFAIDIPIAVLIFEFHQYRFLNGLVVALAALIHINHVFSVGLAEREARRLDIAQREPPPTRIVAAIKRRRLRDYSNPKLELGLFLITASALGWLVHCYSVRGQDADFGTVFGAPVVLLYLQLGLLLVKMLILQWRAPIAAAAAEQEMRAREERRAFYLWNCDFYRVVAVTSVAFWAMQLNISPLRAESVRSIWLSSAILISVILAVWMEMKRKRLAVVDSRLVPISLPDFFDQQQTAKWPVCYDRSSPLLVLRGSRGYSLNLANTFNCLAAAYLAGLVTLVAVLLLGHR